jgi:hypothetical protein
VVCPIFPAVDECADLAPAPIPSAPAAKISSALTVDATVIAKVDERSDEGIWLIHGIVEELIDGFCDARGMHSHRGFEEDDVVARFVDHGFEMGANTTEALNLPG